MNELSNGALWRDHHFVWKTPDTWVPQLSTWLKPHFRPGAMRHLKPGKFRELPWDDPEWSRILEQCLVGTVEYHAKLLAEELEHSTLRAYHGCRTTDAGSYFREGLRIHDRTEMTARLRAIVESHPELNWIKARIDSFISEINNTRDIGRLYVSADDGSLRKHAAHYLIYGSEWITAVLGPPGHRVLRSIGVPTFIEVDLPLHMSNPETLTAFARKMLSEWTRLTCNLPDWSAPIDFTFEFQRTIPANCIVGHSHPTELKDPLDQYRVYRASNGTCAQCRNA